jgi:predicted enzyme related to lactoylglutathione lyase
MAEFASYLPGTPCWVDLTTTDLDSSKAFYTGLFGWEVSDAGEEAGGAILHGPVDVLDARRTAVFADPTGAAGCLLPRRVRPGRPHRRLRSHGLHRVQAG